MNATVPARRAERETETVTPAQSPDTVTEAVAHLADLGYHADLKVFADGLGLDETGNRFPFAESTVDHTFRFEGQSNPDDESIVLGITCPGGLRGVIVSAYGPAADPDEAALLRLLARPPAS
jgi:hypothetical protein